MRLVSLLLTLIFLLPGCDPEESRATPGTPLAALNQLDVREWDNDPAYERAAFGPAWADIDRNGCDQRNDILRRDLEDVKIRPGSRGCVVETGKFQDPYDARVSATFRRGKTDVDIDHVVALKNAWLTGAGDWSSGTKGHPGMRDRLANDPLNLIAVWGSINLRKSDSDFAAWQPNDNRCGYAVRQISVKVKYGLSVTKAEKKALGETLSAAYCASLKPQLLADAEVAPPKPAR